MPWSDGAFSPRKRTISTRLPGLATTTAFVASEPPHVLRTVAQRRKTLCVSKRTKTATENTLQKRPNSVVGFIQSPMHFTELFCSKPSRQSSDFMTAAAMLTIAMASFAIDDGNDRSLLCQVEHMTGGDAFDCAPPLEQSGWTQYRNPFRRASRPLKTRDPGVQFRCRHRRSHLLSRTRTRAPARSASC